MGHRAARTGSIEVEGVELMTPKVSAVGRDAELAHRPIDGVRLRPTRPVAHDDGVVAEIARVDWPEIDAPIVHTHLTTTAPGRVRGWGLHGASTDRLFVVKGLVSIVVYDGRLDSPTRGSVNEFKLSERNPGLLVIPPNLYHGWKVIGVDEAFIVNMPTSLYDYDEPDALDLPYDSPEAEAVVPWRW